ncbi:MAG: hypothetical protein WB711_09015, partial [Terriglobales bacterium]
LLLQELNPFLFLLRLAARTFRRLEGGRSVLEELFLPAVEHRRRTIMGVTRSGGSKTVQDDLISATQGVQDSTLAMYAVGESVQDISQGTISSIGYSRFTTATSGGNTPAWLVGAGAPSGSCSVGALYSCTGNSTACTSSSGNAALWECVGGTTAPWHKVL